MPNVEQVNHDNPVVSVADRYFDRLWLGQSGARVSRKNIAASLGQGVSRVDPLYVDVYTHHRPDPRTDMDETMGSLASAVGLGVSSLHQPQQHMLTVKTPKLGETLHFFEHCVGIPTFMAKSDCE